MTLDTLVEPLAVLTGIACVALTVRQRILSWPIGIVSSALFLVLFLRAGLYADSALQVLYVALGFYGWWHWLHGGPVGGDLPVRSASTRLRLAIAVGALVATAALGTLLDAATDSTLPYPDAATTVLSVTAQLLLTRKLIETWPVWIFGVNVPFVAIYLYKGLALTAALQLVFIALSVLGWVAWRRSMADRAGRAPAGSPPPIPTAVAEGHP
jgi:nicotinamide mononucleotide transporter